MAVFFISNCCSEKVPRIDEEREEEKDIGRFVVFLSYDRGMRKLVWALVDDYLELVRAVRQRRRGEGKKTRQREK